MQPTSEKCSYVELSCKEDSLKENWFCFKQNQDKYIKIIEWFCERLWDGVHEDSQTWRWSL